MFKSVERECIIIAVKRNLLHKDRTLQDSRITTSEVSTIDYPQIYSIVKNIKPNSCRID